MPETLDSREEQQLLDAVKRASELVTSGMTPDDAVEKVARDNRFGPGKIQLMGHAYNTGQQLGQWRSAEGNILNKLASFALCNPQNVIDRISEAPASEKKASAQIDSEYTKPPSWFGKTPHEKSAAYKIPESPKPTPYAADPAEALHKAFGSIQRAKQAADEARRTAEATADQVRVKVAQLVEYFRRGSHDRLPFKTVEAAAKTYCGPMAGQLLDMVYRDARLTEKRATDHEVAAKPCNQNTAPFTLISSAITTAAKCAQLRKTAADLDKTHTELKTEALRPFSKASEATLRAPTGQVKLAFGFGKEIAAIAAGDILAHKATEPKFEDEDPYGDVGSIDAAIEAVREAAKQPSLELSFDKKAFLGIGLGAALGSSFGRAVGNMPKPKDDMVQDAWMNLEDPDHENELRKIRAHAMINQLMTDPDDPISGHDPDRVLSAYNEIASSTPRLADNVAMLRPALRKRLEGHQEPFEAKELLDIEKGLAQTKLPTPNTSALSETPDRMLG